MNSVMFYVAMSFMTFGFLIGILDDDEGFSYLHVVLISIVLALIWPVYWGLAVWLVLRKKMGASCKGATK